MGWSFLLFDGVGAVVSLGSQPGIVRLEGRVVTGRLFVCCPGFPLPALDCSLGFFVGRQGSLLAFTVGELDAFDALLALLSICSGRRFFTSQPYSPLGWGHSLVVSSFALFTVSDFFWGVVSFWNDY